MWLQSPRAIEVVSPLGQDVLVFARMSGSEGLGRLFEYELNILAETDNLDLN